MTDNHSNEIAKCFENILWAIGKQVSEQFKVNVSQVMLDQYSDVSEGVKYISKCG